jgi:sulfocyanin SoxE-like protein
MADSLIVPALSGLSCVLACVSQRPADPPASPSDTTRASSTAPATSPDPNVQGRSSTGLPSWMIFDSAGRKVTLSLETGAGAAGSSALINGYRSGGVRVTVPVGWTVQWNWRNADHAPHSLVVMTQREKIPLEGGRPAFSNAMSRSVTDGLASGESDQSSFEAEETGWYWLLCGVPNHALNGEWIELRVDPDAKKPDVMVKSPAPS